MMGLLCNIVSFKWQCIIMNNMTIR